VPEPIFEKTIELPLGYSLTARARPSTIKRTVVRLLPWAVYAMMPSGRRARLALGVARRVSPIMKQKLRR
jgi:hypothetical protein